MEASAADSSVSASAERLRLRAQARQRRLLGAESVRRLQVVTGGPLPRSDSASGRNREELVINANGARCPDAGLHRISNQGRRKPSFTDLATSELQCDARPRQEPVPAHNGETVSSGSVVESVIAEGSGNGVPYLCASPERTVEGRRNQIAVAEGPPHSPSGNSDHSSASVCPLDPLIIPSGSSDKSRTPDAAGNFLPRHMSVACTDAVPSQDSAPLEPGTVRNPVGSRGNASGRCRPRALLLKYVHVGWELFCNLAYSVGARWIRRLTKLEKHLPTLWRLHHLHLFLAATASAILSQPPSSYSIVGPSLLEPASKTTRREHTETTYLTPWHSMAVVLAEGLRRALTLAMYQPLLWVLTLTIFLLVVEHSRELYRWFERKQCIQNERAWQCQQQRAAQPEREASTATEETADGTHSPSQKEEDPEFLPRLFVWVSHVSLVMKWSSVFVQIMRQVAVFVAVSSCMLYGFAWLASSLGCSALGDS